jgi:hypothetical protein
VIQRYDKVIEDLRHQPTRRKLCKGGYVEMLRPPELFATSAIILLCFAFLTRFINPGVGVSVSWRGNGYFFPPASVCIALATGLCFIASVYSLWMLPFSRSASLLHFWLTSLGIMVFWVAFYRVTPHLPESRTALWTVFASPLLVLFAQFIFLWNVVHAVTKMPRLRS